MTRRVIIIKINANGILFKHKGDRILQQLAALGSWCIHSLSDIDWMGDHLCLLEDKGHERRKSKRLDFDILDLSFPSIDFVGKNNREDGAERRESVTS